MRQLNDDTKLIVTTIQKLNAAISKKTYLNGMAAVKDARIVFIFDECHRSQFGDTHKPLDLPSRTKPRSIAKDECLG